MPMSKFNNAFSSSARTLMTVFGESSPATYKPKDGVEQSLIVAVERGVNESGQAVIMITPTVVISWLKADRSQHAKNDVITLSGGESFRLNKLTEDDGAVISYQVVKA